APILIFVALDIMVQAFLACPARHAPAVAFAHLPSMARLVAIKFGNPAFIPVERFRSLLMTPASELPEVLGTVALGHGSALSAMLWAAVVPEMIERRLVRSAMPLGILAVFPWLGVAHSASPDGNVYFPRTLPEPLQRAIPNQFGLGYLVLALLMLVLARTKQSREAPPADLGHP